MTHSLRKLDKSEVEFTITVTPLEYNKQLEKSVQRLAARASIKGFRPGHVPADVIKKEIGEMAILQEAVEPIIQESFYESVNAEKIETIGMPKITIGKLAPGNDIIYTATVALIPKAILPDIKKIKIKKRTPVIDETEIDKVIEDLRKMHAVETVKKGIAESTDKLVLDMDMILDNVPVEGGQAKDYQVYLDEDHYIPGFNKELFGLAGGSEKKFALTFPKDHYQKMLAGRLIDFKIKVKNVFERTLPEMSDDLAKKLGAESMEKLRELIHTNLLNEATQKSEQGEEIEILEELIKQTKFDDIPDIIIESEKKKIFFELKQNLDRNGIPIEKYLEDLKKSEDELFKDFTAQATKRAKAALISRNVAKTEHLEANEKEISNEVDFLKTAYKDNKEYLANLERPDVRESVASLLQNKKVIKWLKDNILEA